MSQHPSLKIDSVGKKHRNVLNRLERIKKLQKENKWDESQAVYGLPKVKSQKIKVKKSVGPDKEAAEGAEEKAAEKKG